MVGPFFGKILCSYGDFLVTFACVRQNANVTVSLLKPFDILALSTLYTNIVNFWRGDIFAILIIFYQNEPMTDVSINKKLALTRYKHLLFLPMPFPLRCVMNNWCRIQQYTDWFYTFTSLPILLLGCVHVRFYFSLPLIFTLLAAPCWPLAFLIVSPPLWIFVFFFLQNSSLLFSITRSSSFSVIHVSVNIKNNVEKDTTLLLFFLS